MTILWSRQLQKFIMIHFKIQLNFSQEILHSSLRLLIFEWWSQNLFISFLFFLFHFLRDEAPWDSFLIFFSLPFISNFNDLNSTCQMFTTHKSVKWRHDAIVDNFNETILGRSMAMNKSFRGFICPSSSESEPLTQGFWPENKLRL